MWAYRILDYFFVVFHLAIVVMNLFGWIWRPTRKACFVLQVLTAGSWFGLGLFYGIGYCPFTEWHWQVLSKMGELPAETSYLQYLFRRIAGWNLEARPVEAATLTCFLITFAASVVVNLRDWLRRKTNL